MLTFLFILFYVKKYEYENKKEIEKQYLFT